MSPSRPRRFDNPQGHGQLALAAVDEEELGRIGEPPAPLVDRLLPFDQVGGEPAGQHLLHGRVVVVLIDALDLEAAVLTRAGEPVLHHDHGAHIVRALDVAHVVALDPQRRLGEVERLLQGVEGPGAGVVVGGPLEAMAGELLSGVAGHGVEKGLAVPSLGHPHLDP